MNPSFNIAVVGNGTTGAAAALFLHRLGHRVFVFERVVESAPVGAGFLLQPTGVAVLQKLELAQNVCAYGSPIKQLLTKTSTHTTLLDLRYEEVQPGLHGIGIHRAVVHKALLDAIHKTSIRVEWNCEIVSIADGSSPRGAWLIDSLGQKHGPFHLVVVADGARSLVRKNFPYLIQANEYPWGALWFIGEASPVFTDTLLQRVHGVTQMAGLLPTGRTFLANGNTSNVLTSLFWSVRCDRIQSLYKKGLDAWKQDVIALIPEAENVLSLIDSFDQLAFARYHDVVLNPWHAGRVVFIGDAGHAMSPQLGQGVNLGLCDANVLAQCLVETQDVLPALSLYSYRRRNPLTYYQWVTRWLTPFFQSERHVLGALRDSFLSRMGRISWVRRQMVLTMAGVKTSVWVNTMPSMKNMTS